MDAVHRTARLRRFYSAAAAARSSFEEAQNAFLDLYQARLDGRPHDQESAEFRDRSLALRRAVADVREAADALRD